MKRIRNGILVLVTAFTLSACGKTGQERSVSENMDALKTESIKNEEASENDDMFNENKADTKNQNSITNSADFNFDTKTVMLNSGYEMPIYGIGTYSLTGDTCVKSVTAALSSGVRLIDTAYMYHNEESVGEAVRNSDIPREEIFVTTKLYPNQFADPEAAIEEALTKLDIEYIDLMLLHHPGAGDVEAYLAMEKAVAAGK